MIHKTLTRFLAILALLLFLDAVICAMVLPPEQQPDPVEPIPAQLVDKPPQTPAVITRPTPELTPTPGPTTTLAPTPADTPELEPSTPPAADPVEEPSTEPIEAAMLYTEADVAMVARTIWGEARGLDYADKCKVAWCITNRADAWGLTIAAVVTAPNQFQGYASSFPLDEECLAVATDVLTRWSQERQGVTVERELGPEYLFFSGDGVTNHYRTEY